MAKKRENWARFGMFSKGVVYFLIGALTALTAFNLGGEKADKDSVLQFLARQPFGKILLVALSIGLFGYVFFRLYQAFYEENRGWTSLKGFFTRTAYIVSALFYGLLGVASLRLFWKGYLGSKNENILQSLLSKEYGMYILILIALGVLVKGVVLFYQAFSKKYVEDIKKHELGSGTQKLLVNVGFLGYVSRGIISVVFCYLLLRTSFGDHDIASDKTAVFEFLQNTFGGVLMGLVALGLLVYGVFMFLQAKYTSFKVS